MTMVVADRLTSGEYALVSASLLRNGNVRLTYIYNLSGHRYQIILSYSQYMFVDMILNSDI